MPDPPTFCSVVEPQAVADARDGMRANERAAEHVRSVTLRTERSKATGSCCAAVAEAAAIASSKMRTRPLSHPGVPPRYTPHARAIGA